MDHSISQIDETKNVYRGARCMLIFFSKSRLTQTSCRIQNDEHTEYMLTDSSLVAFAKKYETPLFVYDIDAVDEHIQTLQSVQFPFDVTVKYAAKANTNKHVIQRMSA